MIYLLLSIASSALINVIFRWFRKFEINNRQAITINYFTCVAVGLLFYHSELSSVQWTPSGWWILSLSLGILFITVFHWIARTAQEMGVGIAAVSAKMSVLFPLTSGVLFFAESLSSLQLVGILLSLIGVGLISKPEPKAVGDRHAHWWLPVLVFIGSGMIDSLLKAVQSLLGNNDASVSGMLIFGSAGILGLVMNLRDVILKKELWESRNVLAGILLGIPNYFSIYFLLKALSAPGIPSVYVFPVNNVGVVLLASFLGFLLFRERYGLLKIIGMLLAVSSIAMMQWG